MNGHESVTPTPETLIGAPTTSTPASPAAPEPQLRRRSKPRRSHAKRTVIASCAVVAALAIGASVTAHAHKHVTLDVDGQVRAVGTFRRSVASLLEREGIELDENDVVTPEATARLADGDAIVIRLGHEVDFKVDGEPATEWIAALNAADLLDTLNYRGYDVRLVASRDGARTELPLRMVAPGALIAVVADGRTVTVPYAGAPLDETMLAAGVTVSGDDTVTLVPPAAAGISGDLGAELAVVVQRIRSAEVRERFDIEYESVETTDPNRYYDLAPVVVQEGELGEYVRVYLVTTVDGAEVSRQFVSEAVTIEPTDHIVARGTRVRPLPTGGFGEATWRALAQCESSGNPRAVSAGGRFFGLYQFSIPTWQSMGGTGLPSNATPLEQRQRAVALQARWGWGQWPACSARLGLR